MNEFEIAQNLIEGFNSMKQQNSKTTAMGANINGYEFKNCDFELLRKFLYNKKFNMKIEQIDKGNFVIISPIL